MSTKYKHSHEVPTAVLAKRLNELSDAVGKQGEERDRELTRRIPAELDRDADLVLSEAAQRLLKMEAERDALAAHVERLRKAALVAIPYLSGGEIKAELRDAYDDTPETSLANRDVEQQKIGAASFRHEIMESVQAPFRPHIQGVFVVWLRRQAEGENQ